MIESLFVISGLFFIADLLLVISALIDAIQVRDDSMYEAGTSSSGSWSSCWEASSGRSSASRSDGPHRTTGPSGPIRQGTPRQLPRRPQLNVARPRLYDGVIQSGARPGPEPMISDTMRSRSSADPKSITT